MEAYRSAPRLDTPTWQSKQHEISARLHARIIAGGYSAAETDIAALVGGTDCRLFDAVLVEDFTTPIPVFAARLHGWIADAHRAGATALSVDLGRGLGDPKLWSCDVCGLSDRVYPFSTSSREELLTAPEPGPWRGHGGWRPPDGIRIDGFENYIAAGMAHSPADTADAAVAENLPVMVGLKYLRFVDAADIVRCHIGRAGAGCRTTSYAAGNSIEPQDHDSYWIPRGISRTHG